MYEYGCMVPWAGMDVMYNGNIRVRCCDYRFSSLYRDPDAALDIMSVWNDPWFVRARSFFRGDSLEGSGCRGCSLTKSDEQIADEWLADNLNPLQEENLRKALQNYRDRVEEVDHAPCTYQFHFGLACNLKCIMCTQHDSRRQEKTFRELSADELLANEDTLAKAASISCFGGEPLLIKESRKFIRAMVKRPKLRDVRLRITTNGLLLNDMLPLLKEKEKVFIHVSMDSIGEAYEKIRVGSSWDVVSRSVDRFLEIKEKYRPDWQLRISGLIMKTSLPVLPEYVQWCLDRDIDLRLGGLFPTRQTDSEDLVRNPALLDEIDGWEEKFERTRDAFAAAGRPEDVGRMDWWLRTLRSPAGAQTQQETDELEGALEALVGSGRKVVIWGTGSNYRHCFQEWIVRNRSALEFCGFVDNDPARWGTECDGSSVHDPEFLSREGIEVVLVASQHRAEIAAQIRGMKGCSPQVI